jgi:hypothetical protein
VAATAQMHPLYLFLSFLGQAEFNKKASSRALASVSVFNFKPFFGCRNGAQVRPLEVEGLRQPQADFSLVS